MMLLNWHSVSREGSRWCEPLEPRLCLSGTVVSGDFTGNGITDIVTTRGGLKLRAGNGNGTFQAGVPINGTGFARGGSVAAADFNEDGSLDIAVFGGTSTTSSLKNATRPDKRVNGGLFVLFNNGNGTFQRAVPISNATINSSRIPNGDVATGDYNLDGNADILVTSGGGSTTPTSFNSGASSGFFVGTSFGNAGFGTSANSSFFGANSLTGPTGGNLLGTGTTDLLGGSSGNGDFLGTNGTFGVGTGNTFGASALPPAGQFGTASASTGSVGPPEGSSFAYLIYGNGNGTFQAPRRITLT